MPRFPFRRSGTDKAPTVEERARVVGLVKDAMTRGPRVLTAAGATFDSASKSSNAWTNFRGGGQNDWQNQAWYHYDACGELRFGLNWKAAIGSQALMYAAVVDPDTGRPMGPADDERVQAAARAALGGVVQRSQNLRRILLNVSVSGEAFIVVRPDRKRRRTADTPAPDQWVILSVKEISGSGGGVEYTDPDTGEPATLTAQDRLMRIWSPHPAIHRAADSSVRAVLPVLAEIERASQNVMARLESRIASAGMLLVPSEIEYPHGDDDEEITTADGVMKALTEAMSTGIREPGSAVAQVPVVFTLEGEQIPNVTHLKFDTPVSAEVTELRDRDINRMAAGIDLPAEIVTGMDLNHWSAWLVQEAAITTQVMPDLDRIADAMTQAWFTDVLVAMGVEQPERYMLAFDVTDLVSKPDRLADMLRLYEQGIVSDDALARAAGIPDDDRPSDDDRRRTLAERLVTGAPTLLADPRIADLLGFPALAPAVAGIDADGTSGPDGDGPDGDDGPDDGRADDRTPPDRDALTAAGVDPFGAVEMALLYGLDRVGARLLNTPGGRHKYPDTPHHEAHTVVPYGASKIDALSADLWRHSGAIAEAWDLTGYVRSLLAARCAHTPESLRAWMVARA